MNHNFVGSMIAILALSDGSYSPTSAQPVRHYAGEVEVLVNGIRRDVTPMMGGGTWRR